MNLRKISFLVSGILLLLSIFTPYLLIIFTSPQYPDRSPKMYLYLHSLRGDIRDWEVVGRYIGVNVHPVLPEFDYKIIVFVIVFLSLLAFMAFFKDIKWQKLASMTILVFGILLALWAQYRLYQQGHNLDPNAPLRYVVKSFTPPLLGLTRVSKIRIYHLPHLGFFLYAGATFLTIYFSWLKGRVR
jgi:copper chaperone NosL